MITRGNCLCKKVKWEFKGEVNWQCYCHCDDCRRNCGAPIVAWLGVPLSNFRWTGVAPNTYKSIKGALRHFCGNCGSPVGFEAEHYINDIALYAASLENPSEFEPTFHVNYESKLNWLNIEDEHPKYNNTLAHLDKDFSN